MYDYRIRKTQVQNNAPPIEEDYHDEYVDALQKLGFHGSAFYSEVDGVRFVCFEITYSYPEYTNVEIFYFPDHVEMDAVKNLLNHDNTEGNDPIKVKNGWYFNYQR